MSSSRKQRPKESMSPLDNNIARISEPSSWGCAGGWMGMPILNVAEKPYVSRHIDGNSILLRRARRNLEIMFVKRLNFGYRCNSTRASNNTSNNGKCGNPPLSRVSITSGGRRRKFQSCVRQQIRADTRRLDDRQTYTSWFRPCGALNIADQAGLYSRLS